MIHCRITYDYDSLSIYDQYPRGKDWGRQIDSLWNAYSSSNNEKLKKDMCIDIKVIKCFPVNNGN